MARLPKALDTRTAGTARQSRCCELGPRVEDVDVEWPVSGRGRPLGRDYSDRSAVVGSTRSARAAGTRPASTPTAVRIPAATANDATSSAETPKS
jgi:hypothetical protein